MGQIGQMGQMGQMRKIDMTSLTYMTKKWGKVTGSKAEKRLLGKDVDKQGRISLDPLQAILL